MCCICSQPGHCASSLVPKQFPNACRKLPRPSSPPPICPKSMLSPMWHLPKSMAGLMPLSGWLWVSLQVVQNWRGFCCIGHVSQGKTKTGNSPLLAGTLIQTIRKEQVRIYYRCAHLEAQYTCWELLLVLLSQDYRKISSFLL